MSVRSLVTDSHVHTEWSWDTGPSLNQPAGLMRGMCAQAVRIGLPAVTFSDHLDLDPNWVADPEDLQSTAATQDVQGHVRLPRFDMDDYLAAIDDCRQDFPELRIISGIELGQPHLHGKEAQRLGVGRLDVVNGSLHTLPFGQDRAEPKWLFRRWDHDRVVWAYLDEALRAVDAQEFDVFTHIDYAVRYWPIATAGPFPPDRFEEGFRAVMRRLAGTGRALEMNTVRLWPWIPRWWKEEGGRMITLGSDAHTSSRLAADFHEAADMVEVFGFRPKRRPLDVWTLLGWPAVQKRMTRSGVYADHACKPLPTSSHSTHFNNSS